MLKIETIRNIRIDKIIMTVGNTHTLLSGE